MILILAIILWFVLIALMLPKKIKTEKELGNNYHMNRLKRINPK